VDVALTKDQVFIAADLDLVMVLGAEQHLVVGLDVANVRSDGDDLGPDQPLGDLRRGGNEDAAARASLAITRRDLDEHAVAEHADRLLRRGLGHWKATVPSRAVIRETSETLVAADGVSLDGELRVPDDAWAAAVLTHPHPLQGGSMRTLVPSELFDGLPAAGIAALRFDFRGTGRSGGQHDGGPAERDDVRAAVATLASTMPGVPLIVAGWSFGADVSLGIDDDALAGWFAVAPPLQVLEPDELVASRDPRPKLLAVPEHDEITPPAEARARTADWIETRIEVIAGASHVPFGRTDRILELAVAFCRTISG
jgi:uncharacterized protein